MSEIDIFIDEDDPKADELLIKYNRVKWLATNENALTIISYNELSWWRRKLCSWILNVIWSKVDG